MKEIIYKDKLYGVVHRAEVWKEELDFLSRDSDFVQVGTWWYNSGRILKAHKHIENVRVISFTQECIIVMNGKVQVDLYDTENAKFEEFILSKGDLAVLLCGGHGYKILEDNTKVVEVKGGQFISVDKDKELL